jgi:methionyl-tRNA formyltransferase
MRFIFAGTTEFGIPTLEKLLANGHELLFVITQPDKPTGRKQELTAPPIKLWAQKNNVRVLQPEKIADSFDEIALPKPDLLLVAAYGQIVPKEILDIPKSGSANIHGSILPQYRGASPIQNAILNGDPSTGITLIRMDEKMDHGPIIATKSAEIKPEETFLDVYKNLSLAAAELTADILPKYIRGEIQAKEQNHDKATFTKLLTKSDARIDWTNRAQVIINQIRALNPEPGTWTTLDGKNVKIIEAKLLQEAKIELPGKLYSTLNGLAVKTTDQSLLLIKVQPEGKNTMTGRDFQNGLKSLEGKHFI